ncbi:MAG TPA: hypothetical protein VK427_22610, partial [Kofleriaceae bacterium]|nr:hypothetical protein [Kofleriaceae bacterium]
MRLALLIAIVAACRGEPKPQIHEDAAAPPPMTPSNNTAVRDATFVAVPTAAAVADVLARIVTKSPEESAKEIMRTLGRLGWKLGSQRYDVYLPQATR